MVHAVSKQKKKNMRKPKGSRRRRGRRCKTTANKPTAKATSWEKATAAQAHRSRTPWVMCIHRCHGKGWSTHGKGDGSGDDERKESGDGEGDDDKAWDEKHWRWRRADLVYYPPDYLGVVNIYSVGYMLTLNMPYECTAIEPALNKYFKDILPVHYIRDTSKQAIAKRHHCGEHVANLRAVKDCDQFKVFATDLKEKLDIHFGWAHAW